MIIPGRLQVEISKPDTKLKIPFVQEEIVLKFSTNLSHSTTLQLCAYILLISTYHSNHKHNQMLVTTSMSSLALPNNKNKHTYSCLTLCDVLQVRRPSQSKMLLYFMFCSCSSIQNHHTWRYPEVCTLKMRETSMLAALRIFGLILSAIQAT